MLFSKMREWLLSDYGAAQMEPLDRFGFRNPTVDFERKVERKMIQIGRLARQLTGSEFVSTDTQEIFQYFDQYGRNELLRELDGIFRECQKVYRRNGGKIHNSQELINSQSVLA